MKKQDGITLVALVITIIVLLILAGVSISLVVGNNGVLTQASSSVVTNKAADARQALQMAQAAVETTYYAEWASNTARTREDVYKDGTNGLAKELDKLGYTLTGINGKAPTASGASLLPAGKVVIQNSAGEYFVFSNVTVNASSGKMEYGTGGTGGTLKVYTSKYTEYVDGDDESANLQGKVDL